MRLADQKLSCEGKVRQPNFCNYIHASMKSNTGFILCDYFFLLKVNENLFTQTVNISVAFLAISICILFKTYLLSYQSQYWEYFVIYYFLLLYFSASLNLENVN